MVYGLDGYKVHSKLCLITRKTDAGVEYYTQIGTGNYNEKTSRLYTDLSYMTSRVEIGLEAADVFQALDKGETVKETRHLLVAPNCLQNKVLTMLSDNQKAREEDGEGKYHLVYRQEDTPLNSQEFFYEDAYQASYDLGN